jgi:para-nitrobenzyl esterase
VAIGGVSGQTAGTIVSVEGGSISGTSEQGVRVYKGIPYAAPPVGSLRWKPPQPVASWNGMKHGDQVGPACPHLPRASDSPFPEALERKSEDCLYLNVWTSARSGAAEPVMVWYHGGNWARGSGVAFTPTGVPLARKGVVVVTVNYRLGALGFLAHPELTAESPHRSSGNYGFLDQIAALRWVQKNIAGFGGDPNRVTIFGESAGSWTVSVLMASPLAKGLFHRAVGQSGGRFAPQAFLSDSRNGVTSAERNGQAFLNAAGADTIATLRTMPAEQLLTVPGFTAHETVDGWLLPDEVRTIYAQGRHNEVPLIVGSNANESASTSWPKTLGEYRALVEARYGDMIGEFDEAYPVRNQEDIPAALNGVSGHGAFNLPMRTWARRTAGGRAKTYMYYFSHRPPHPTRQELGAHHTFEIPYVFNHLAQPGWVYGKHDFHLADVMSSYWVNFAGTGDPNGKGLPQWAAYDLATESYLEFGDSVTLRHQLLKRQLDFVERFQLRRANAN